MCELPKKCIFIATNSRPQKRITASHCALHVLQQLERVCEIITGTNATSNAYYFIEDYVFMEALS